MTLLPAAEYTTYIGDANEYHIVRAIADAAGNTYIGGSRTFHIESLALHDVFVMKLDASGKTVLFATFTGKGDDQVKDVAVDAAGNIYVAGATTSPDLPLHNPMQSAPGSGFLAKFSGDSGQVLYATYFPEAVRGLAVDAAGNMYVTGSTVSSDFPVTAGLPASRVGFHVPIITGAFVTKIAAAGDRILYSTVLAGSGKDCGGGSSCFTGTRSAAGAAIAVDAAGNAYFTGNTDITNLPTTPGAMLATGPGAFVGKVNAAGTALSYLTYIGPGNLAYVPFSYPANKASAIAVDAAGNVYVVGSTFDPHFPATPGAYQTVFNGPADLSGLIPPTPPPDAFAIKINPTGSAAVWATYLGGKDGDIANSVAVDGAGKVWVSGSTASAEFPNAQGWSTGQDFVFALNPTGSALAYSGRYPNGTASQTVSADAAGLVHLAGPGGIVSAIAPAGRPLMRVFGIANAAFGDVGGRIAPGEVISIYGPHIGPAQPALYTGDSSGAVPTLLGGVQVYINDIPAPLIYVSDSQINAVTPFGIAGQGSARVRVVFNNDSTPDFPAALLFTAPAVFQNPDGSAAAINQDGTVNSPDHPAKSGTAVSIWVTGVRTFALTDGQIATAAENFGCCLIYAETTSNLLLVLYGGAAPGMVAGVVQVNFRLPVYENFGLAEILLYSGSQFANPVTIYVAP